MRHDMPKVITEAPRSGIGYYRTLPNDYRRAKTFRFNEDLQVDDEFTARVLPMRAKKVGWDGKSPRLSYKAVRRFLHSRVGRLWNDVYSEICHTFRGQAVQALNLRGLFLGDVETNTYADDKGRVCYKTRWGMECVDDGGVILYVDPHTGILCLSRGESHKLRNKERMALRDARYAAEHREMDGQKFKKIEGTWFQILSRESRQFRGVWEEVKRTVSKADLRRYELQKIPSEKRNRPIRKGSREFANTPPPRT